MTIPPAPDRIGPIGVTGTALGAPGMARVMPLLIENDVQERVLEMPAVVDAIEDAFVQLGRGDAAYEPRRTEILSPEAMPHPEIPEARTYFKWAALRGAIRDPPRFALRFRSDIPYAYEYEGAVTREKFNGEPGLYMGIVLLFDTWDGTLLAILNDGVLQHDRVGATAAVACKHLSRSDASVVGMLGSSGMARAYAEALDVVRDLTRIDVYSPTRSHREAYAEEMSAALDLDVRAVDRPGAAVEGADIVATCTSSLEPVLDPDWIEPGRFFVNVSRKEVPAAYEHEVDAVFTTTNRGATTHVVGSPDLLEAAQPASGRRGDVWGANEDLDLPTLPELLVGDVEPPDPTEASVLYLNRSNGIQFPAIADLIYEAARERDLGTELPLSWFQQTLRT